MPGLVDRRAVLANESVALSAAPDRKGLERDDATGELHVDFPAFDALHECVIDRWHPIDARDERAPRSAAGARWTRESEQLVIAQVEDVTVPHRLYAITLNDVR